MKKNALRLTRALKKTVEKHGLELVHVGSLSCELPQTVKVCGFC